MIICGRTVTPYALDSVSTIGISGVSSWRNAGQLLEKLEAKVVHLAFDADACTKQGVGAALADLYKALKERYIVQIDTWPAEQGKGIDDFLLKGGKPESLAGEAADAYVAKLLSEPAQETVVQQEVDPVPTKDVTAEAPTDTAMKGPDRFPYGDEPKPFPIDFFPTPLQEVVNEITSAVNCPLDLAACAMVTAAATAIGRSRQLEPKDDWKISPRIFMGLVADPGSAKTPALTKIMRPLWNKNHKWNEEYQKEMSLYEIEKMAYDAQKKEFQKDVAKRTKQEEGRGRQVAKETEGSDDCFDETAAATQE